MKDLSMKELTTIALLGVLILISGSLKSLRQLPVANSSYLRQSPYSSAPASALNATLSQVSLQVCSV